MDQHCALYFIRVFARRAHPSLRNTLSRLCGSSRSSLRSCEYFCRRKTAVTRGGSRKVYNLIAVNTVPSRSSRHICGYIQSSVVVKPQRTAAWTAQVCKGYIRDSYVKQTMWSYPQTFYLVKTDPAS